MRVRQSDFDAILGASSSGEARGLGKVDQDELRAELAMRLEDARGAADDDAELASTMRALAEAATRLAQALERAG